jgi:RNA polymerase sigma-70 factor, ECF subfamily
MRDADQLYEQLLVVRAQAGDETAFAELVARFQPRLAYFVRRLIGDAHAADDVLQNIWLQAYTHLAQLRDAGSLSVWLYRIARNAVLATLRRHRGWEELTTEPAAADDCDVAGDFSVADAERIHAALARLRPEHREVLVLRFIENMSYEEIAAIVGCPVGTVRSRIHYAKQAVRPEVGG